MGVGNISSDLIFDIGVSEGNDSAYYLSKGFRVVGVEADSVIFVGLAERFAEETNNGSLTLIKRAASDVSGNEITFLHNSVQQGISGTSKHPHVKDGYTEFTVQTLSWDDLVKAHGVPYYCKVDIEGQEKLFLKNIIGFETLPTFFSVECHDLTPVTLLYAIGYRKFKLVDQVPEGGFINPNPPLEGKYVEAPNWHHASGPFGKELPGEWLDFEQFVVAHRECVTLRHRGHWFDCHATV
jgi:FkbM family methyltransferase